jgi:hypothetical protein
MKFIFSGIVCCVLTIGLYAQSKNLATLTQDLEELDSFRLDLRQYQSGDDERKTSLTLAMEREIASIKRKMVRARIEIGASRVNLNKKIEMMKLEKDRKDRSSHKKGIKQEVKAIEVMQREIDSMETRYGRQFNLHRNALAAIDNDQFLLIVSQFAETMEDDIAQTRRSVY